MSHKDVDCNKANTENNIYNAPLNEVLPTGVNSNEDNKVIVQQDVANSVDHRSNGFSDSRPHHSYDLALIPYNLPTVSCKGVYIVDHNSDMSTSSTASNSGVSGPPCKGVDAIRHTGITMFLHLRMGSSCQIRNR